MLQRLYTLLRHISHVASSPWHLSHSPDLRFHIYHHSLVHFACLSAKNCRTPRTVTLRSLQSCRSHTHCTAFSFWVLLLCTALIRRLSVYHRCLQSNSRQEKLFTPPSCIFLSQLFPARWWNGRGCCVVCAGVWKCWSCSSSPPPLLLASSSSSPFSNLSFFKLIIIHANSFPNHHLALWLQLFGQ